MGEGDIMGDFTHFNEDGRAKMVNVGEKPKSVRTARAAARVLVNAETFSLIRSGGIKKGDVLTVAQIAGIMGAKRTPDLIPMCHPILIDGVDLHLSLAGPEDEETSRNREMHHSSKDDSDSGSVCPKENRNPRYAVDIIAEVRCSGRTGVEMEALTAVSVAALTVYDMCKAVQKDMVITDIRLLEKTGGVHGDFSRID